MARPSKRLAQAAPAATAMLAASLLALCLLTPPTASAARVLPNLRRLLTHDASASAAPTPLCAVMGGPAGPTWMNATSTCLQFHAAPAAPIQAPADSATSKWGQIFLQSSNPLISVFIDRQGKQYPISASANPPQDMLQITKIWTMIVVEAQLDATSGNVTSFTPTLYVPYSTIMATMANTKFESVVWNTPPRPVGPNETSWARWTFGDVITVTDPTFKYSTLLQGTFDNLFRAVKDSNGVCRPALCADPTFKSAACQYYTKFFGNTTNAVTLNWDPNMHMPVDSELVPEFPATHRQYMAEFIELYQLLRPYQFVPRQITFIGHGVPLGVPQNFTGLLSANTDAPVFC